MSDIYTHKTGSMEEYLREFQPLANQVGVICFIDDIAIGVDSFGKADTLSKIYRKLVSSYALEALDHQGKQISGVNLKERAHEFLDTAKRGTAECNPSVDLGMDVRIEGEQVIGSGLVLEEQVLHLALFPKNHEGNMISSIQPPSRRKHMMG
jgi:hypothetical protein